MRALNIRKNIDPIHNFNPSESQVINGSVWSKSPGTAEIMEIEKKNRTLKLVIEVDGLLRDNFEVNVVGSQINISIEHKKEYLHNYSSNSLWTNGTTEITKYSVFERSELCLPSTTGLVIQSVEYQKNRRLLIVLDLKQSSKFT